jgi:alkanesulfonate monooxygenase SsuD/methylene tetrahydromethanopterin reductase-like flavin-dependent oxidoreductase (luciferase family)
MKLGSFSLTSYRKLPKNFSEENESIWVSFKSEMMDRNQLHKDFVESLDFLEAGDELGMDFIGVNEHHANGYGLMPSPNLMAAAIARKTSKTAILVLGNSLALYNPPQRVAEEFAMLDCISGGRIIAGFPVGTPMDTCFAYGTNPSELRARYYEAHDIVMEAWRHGKPFDFNGRFNQQRYINITPRPLQSPHPPVWIPAGGSVETWQFCAANDYLYAYLTYFGYQSGEKTVRGFWDEMKKLGKEPNPFQVGISQFIGVAETYEEALRLYEEPATYFFDICLNVHPRWADPPGYVTEATVKAKLMSQVKEAAKRARAGTEYKAVQRQSFKEMVDLGFIILGTPDQVADKIREIAKSQNVGNIMLQLNYGNMSKDLALYNLSLTAKKVVPQLRDLFANEWEHKWMPKGIAGSTHPTAEKAR